jgi:hypothetical protein
MLLSAKLKNHHGTHRDTSHFPFHVSLDDIGHLLAMGDSYSEARQVGIPAENLLTRFRRG